jgi:predicted nucleic acid-binding protein
MRVVDTNILVYARDTGDPAKQNRASAVLPLLWRSHTGSLSTQVLNDYNVTVTRKLAPGLPPKEARDDVRSLFAWKPSVVDQETVEAAWRIEDG